MLTKDEKNTQEGIVELCITKTISLLKNSSESDIRVNNNNGKKMNHKQ